MQKQQAILKFEQSLNNLKHGATNVYEVRSFKMIDFVGIKKAIQEAPTGSALWQHTASWHSVAMFIPQGNGKRFSRPALDLIANDIDSIPKFIKVWDFYNHDALKGAFPRLSGSKTSNSRKQQSSYIVADLGAGEQPNTTIPGQLNPNVPHRTHLISSQITGIEHHKGLLIDYDGWLNSHPMNEFEQDIINQLRFGDVIWTAQVWRESQGLVFQYVMYDAKWNIIAKRSWLDDRWKYIWHFDQQQNLLF